MQNSVSQVLQEKFSGKGKYYLENRRAFSGKNKMCTAKWRIFYVEEIYV